MSSERCQKRRCIIKRLDFENCIVTNSKTTARGRKKLRARITREIEDVPDDLPSDASPVSSQQESQTSPVLLVRSELADRESPVLSRRRRRRRRRRKMNFSGEEESTDKSTIEEPCSSSSPVFKLFKKSKTSSESPGRCRRFSEDDAASSCLESCYQIDETTTQETSKDSIRISSVESAEPKKNRRLSICSVESNMLAGRDSPGQVLSTSCGVDDEKSDSKRNHKKNRLLSRLHKLQQKQASEKLLWQHQNARNSASALEFSVASFWKDEFNFFLKCNSFPSDLRVTFLVVDSRWVPKMRKMKKASVLRLHPPWQKVVLEESGTTVLLNVICLDILDETVEPVGERRTLERIPAEPFETGEKLFVDSLFGSNSCGFLC